MVTSGLRQLPHGHVGVGSVRAPNSVTEVVYVDFRHRRRTRTETMTETDERGGRRSRRGGGAEATSPARNSSETPRLNTPHRYGTRYVLPHGVFTSPVSMSHALTHCELISLTLDPVL